MLLLAALDMGWRLFQVEVLGKADELGFKLIHPLNGETRNNVLPRS